MKKLEIWGPLILAGTMILLGGSLMVYSLLTGYDGTGSLW